MNGKKTHTHITRKSKMNEAQVCIKIKPKGLSQRFEEGEEGDGRSDVFNIIQKRPDTDVHLKIDAAMESCRSYKEVRSR